MSYYFLIHCLDFSLIMIFRFHCSAGLSQCCGKHHMQSVGEERKAYKCVLLCVVQ